MISMADVKFEDYRIEVKAKMSDLIIQWLYEASNKIHAQTTRNTRVDTGELKGSWSTVVSESDMEAVVGSPMENAIWEEFGTGQWALNGNGRKTPWSYQDRKGKWHRTTGKKPQRNLHNSFETNKKSIVKRLEDLLKGMND